MSNKISIYDVFFAACEPLQEAFDAACKAHLESEPYSKAAYAVCDAIWKALNESQDLEKAGDAWNELVDKTTSQITAETVSS